MSAPTYVPGSVPSGQSAPFVVSSPTDDSGVIVIVAATGIALVLVCFVIRLYIRFSFSGPWQVDDTVLALATAAALAQSSVVCVSVHRGWGRAIEDIDPFDLVAAEKLVYAADLLYIVTLALSKHSLDRLFIRLSPYANHFRASRWLRYFCAAWVLASLGAIGLRCHTGQPWIDVTADQCPTMLVRWQVISAFNIASEVAIFLMSIYLVVGLHMSLAKKSMVVAAFGIRLPVIAFCILRIHYFFDAFYTTDPTFDGVMFSAWTQIELTFSIMAATIPCLKPFVSVLSTNWGEQPKTEYTKTSPSGSYGLRDLFGRSVRSEKTKSVLSQVTIRKSTVVAEEQESQDVVGMLPEPANQQHAVNHQMLRGDSVSHAAVVTHGWTLGDDGGSTRSNESQQMIIRKEVMYSVEHDGHSAAEKSQEPEAAGENPGVGHAL